MATIDELFRQLNGRAPKAIIGIAGFAGSGKTSLAEHLLRAHGYTIKPFAAGLKAGVRAAFDLRLDHTDGKSKEVPLPHLCGATPRKLMQALGNQMRVAVDDRIWLEAWRNSCAGIDEVVVPDVRYLNEAELIHACGGMIIRAEGRRGGQVYRPTVAQRLRDVWFPPHVSERPLPARVVDHVIDTSGRIEDSWLQLDRILEDRDTWT